MPLDINLFRAHAGGNPDLIRESQRRRFAPVEAVDQIIEADEKWRFLTGAIDNLKKKRNKIQKDVAIKMKAKEACDDLVSEIKSIGEEIIIVEKEQQNIRISIDMMLSKIGNIVDDSVPVSKDEDADNLVVRRWGTPRDPSQTAFPLLNHHDLLWRIGGYEPDRGVNVAGHRGYFLRDVGVMLNQAFINYAISFLRPRGYCMLQPPYMMKKELMAGVAQLEQFDEELYKVGSDGDDKYLIATSEQPICGYHYQEWLEEKQLPLKYGGVSTCFRKEAGAHGKDTWGIFRVHQFEKVEQFVICEGDLEKSQALQEEMITAAEEFYRTLGFPYQVISIVSGALNNAAIKKYDLEAWFPGYNSYRELVSCSNCTDYQSRAMEIRCGVKKLEQREKKYVHMLNSTLCATGRAICCLLETYQDKDGVHIPEVLVPFMGGLTFLPFVRESKLIPTPIGKPTASIKTPTTSTKVEKVEMVKEKEEKASTPPAPSIPVNTTLNTSEKSALEALIAEKGEEVRVAKANKAEKDVVKGLVDQLLNLKNQFKDLYGGGAAAAPSSTKSPSTAPTSVEKKSEVAVPPVNKEATREKPLYTSPAPMRPVPKEVQASDIFVGETLQVAVLNQWLETYSFIGGYSPNAQDEKAYSFVLDNGTDISSFVNVKRWMKYIKTSQSG